MVAGKLMSPLSLMSAPGEAKKEKGGALSVTAFTA
jgi:hypothetical protein